MADVICFGEVMLRLTVPNFNRFADAPYLDMGWGGAEANTAVQLAQLGCPTAMVSRLPENDLGERCVGALRSRGIDTTFVQRGGDRVGVYFVEPGASGRPTKVIYDRQLAAIRDAKPGIFDWDTILAGAKWFHFSGITPALGDGCAAVCAEACKAARAKGIAISFDVNYRSRLWDKQSARGILLPLMEYVDVVVSGEDEAVNILGAETMDEEETARMPAIAASLAKLHGFKTVAMTCRTSASASDTTFRGMLYTGAGGAHFSRAHDIAIVDRIGTGDAFTGGLIFAMLRGDKPDDAIEFATAAGAWKHTIPGDWNRVTIAELEALAGGAGGGRVQR
jgi:2-dehydro-3-deoxygluconokinase